MEINFSNAPSEAALNPTLIFAVEPGAIGSLLHSGVVQPQLACTSFKTMGLLPLFLISKKWYTGLPCGTLPKSYSISLNCNGSCGAFAVCAFAAVAIRKKINR